MAARDNSRRDAEYENESESVGQDDSVEFDGPEFDGPEYDGPDYDGPDYDGMDALMAALVDEPLSEEALGDGQFMAARRAAVADIALLREQLGLIGEALTSEALIGTDTGPGTADAEETEAEAPPGRRVAAWSGDETGAEGLSGREAAAETGSRREPEPETAPAAPVTPLPTRSARPRRDRRSVPAALAGFAAAAAAFAVVAGLGWLVSQGAGEMSQDAATSKGGEAQSDAGSGSDEADGKVSLEGYIACSRIIVEGTVADVTPITGSGQERVAVDVDRYYKPAEGADEIVFPLYEETDISLKKGDHVLVGIPKNDAVPDLWFTKEKDIDRQRALILDALPSAEGMECE